MYLIPSGKHRVRKFPTKFWWGNRNWHFQVRFDETWKQTWPGENKDDVSKIIGIGCLNLAYLFKLKAPHHWKSVRLGIDYDEENDVMALYEYNYDKGVRSYKRVRSLYFNVTYHIHITMTPDNNHITISDVNDNTLFNLQGPAWKGISYLLKPYYGGNNPTRRDTNVDLKIL